MKHYLKGNFYTEAASCNLKTVRNENRNMKNYTKWAQTLFYLVFLTPSPSEMTDFYFLTLQQRKKLEKVIIIVNIEEDCRVGSNPLPVCYKTLLGVSCLSC